MIDHHDDQLRMWVQDLGAAVSLVLFIGTMLVWAAILSGNLPEWVP